VDTRLVAALAATLVLFAILPYRQAHATASDGSTQPEPGPYVLSVAVDRLTPQDGSTGIQGVVADLAGEPIPGASIAYSGPGTNAEQTVTAGPDGVFRIEGLDPGPWAVTVTAKGYTTRRVAPVTVAAGVMVPVGGRLSKSASFGSQLTRFGAVHAWVAAIVAMGLALWVHHRRTGSSSEPLPGAGVPVVVGVVAGTALGVALAYLADAFVHNIGEQPLSPAPERPDLWLARNGGTQLIAYVSMFTGAILGVTAGLVARRGHSMARCALITATGGAAVGAAVAVSQSPSSAVTMLRLLAMLDEPTSGQMWVVYLSIGIAGSALVGAVVGLCVSGAVVGLTRLSRIQVAAR